MNKSFLRKIEVVTDSKKFDGDKFNIMFEVPFNDESKPNIATVEIYNLSEKTINDLKVKGSIILNAGYKGDVGTILTGKIQAPTTTWKGVDKITVLDCVDSGDEWFTKKIKKTYKAGIDGERILKDLLPMTGLSVAPLKLLNNKVYSNGKTFNTELIEAIIEVAKDCGVKTHVTKEKIYVRPKNDGDDIRYVLDKDHGLIGSPTRIEKEVVTGKDKDKNEIKVKISGWKVVSLLNHRFGTDVIIEIKSKTANGAFRVESGVHKGGSSGNGNYSEMEVYPL